MFLAIGVHALLQSVKALNNRCMRSGISIGEYMCLFPEYVWLFADFRMLYSSVVERDSEFASDDDVVASAIASVNIYATRLPFPTSLHDALQGADTEHLNLHKYI